MELAVAPISFGSQSSFFFSQVTPIFTRGLIFTTEGPRNRLSADTLNYSIKIPIQIPM